MEKSTESAIVSLLLIAIIIAIVGSLLLHRKEQAIKQSPLYKAYKKNQQPHKTCYVTKATYKEVFVEQYASLVMEPSEQYSKHRKGQRTAHVAVAPIQQSRTSKLTFNTSANSELEYAI